MKRVLVLGATSAIAGACMRIWAAQRCDFFLVARDEVRLRAVAQDLLIRGAARVDVQVLDFLQLAAQSAMLDRCFENAARVDIALLAYGTLSDQSLCQRDAAAAVREIESNASSCIALLTLLAQRMVPAGAGTIAVISSVAGERGRASNYTYGAAKAALSAYCDGLRARLRPLGVHVLTIKPGPVATPMTAGTKLPAALVASPEAVARDIDRAIGRRESILYTPRYWRIIMAIIRALPESVLRRLPL